MAFTVDKNEERRKRVFVGTLPPDFLRLSGYGMPAMSVQEQQEAADAQAALALQQQLQMSQYSNPIRGRLSITVAQAKLVKNYGMTRMDPYIRIRVGHNVYETHTDPNGGKNPRWNKVIQCLLPKGVNHIYLEIFDECSFVMDELIAWVHIPIPLNVMKGETYEDWIPLNGKHGEGMEGMVNLVLSYQAGPVQQYATGYYGMSPVMIGLPSATYGVRPLPRTVPVSYIQAPIPTEQLPQQLPPVVKLSTQDLVQVQEMFPNMDKEVVKSVFEANNGNKDLTVNALLQMTD